MDGEQLRALQAPLKDTYRSDPTAALITLRAQGRLGEGSPVTSQPARRWSQLDSILRPVETG